MPNVPTNNICENIFDHLETSSSFGIPDGEMIRATQSLKLCYASCHTDLSNKANARRQNRLDSVARSV
jgi:hypothetical protein